MTDEKTENAGRSEENQRRFDIQKIYTKDLSFETPNSPVIFTQEWKPSVNLQLNNLHTIIAENVHEVLLSMTVTAKLEDKTAYLVEVQQGGIFRIEGFEGQELEHMLAVYCPTVLFPYARETISSLVGRGGFDPINLAPINFDLIYARQKEEALAKQQQESNHCTHDQPAEFGTD